MAWVVNLDLSVSTSMTSGCVGCSTKRRGMNTYLRFLSAHYL